MSKLQRIHLSFPLKCNNLALLSDPWLWGSPGSCQLLQMLTNNTITNIDPGEWLSLLLSMGPEPLQEHVMQAKSQTAGCNHVPTPCGDTNDQMTLWCSYVKCFIAKRNTRNHDHFHFYLSSLKITWKSTISLQRHHPDALHGTAVSCIDYDTCSERRPNEKVAEDSPAVMLLLRITGDLPDDVIFMSVFPNRRASTHV